MPNILNDPAYMTKKQTIMNAGNPLIATDAYQGTNPLLNTPQAQVVSPTPLPAAQPAPVSFTPPTHAEMQVQSNLGAVQLTPEQLYASNAATKALGRQLTDAETTFVRNATADQLKNWMAGNYVMPGAVDKRAAMAASNAGTGQNYAAGAQYGGLQPKAAVAKAEQNRVNLVGNTTDEIMANLGTNLASFFQGDDWLKFPPEVQTYYQQLLTGDTPATRAATQEEANALSNGIRNMMESIGAAAANAGITGGSLSGLYAKGLGVISNMMGDFAIDNIKRMADSQAAGAEGLVKAWGLQGDRAQQWLSTLQDYNKFQRSNSEWDKTFGWNARKYIVEASQNNSAVGVLMAKVTQGLANGQSIDQILTPAEIASLSATVNEGQTLEDLAADANYWHKIGYATTCTQKEVNGVKIFKADGVTPVWEVRVKSHTDPVTGELIMDPYVAPEDVVTPEPPPTPPPPVPLAPNAGAVPTDAEIPGILETLNTTTWDRMTPEQRTAILEKLDTDFNALPNSTFLTAAPGAKIWVRTPDDAPGYIDLSRFYLGGTTGRQFDVYDADGKKVGLFEIEGTYNSVGTKRKWVQLDRTSSWSGIQPI
jgi:hypothetical protein